MIGECEGYYGWGGKEFPKALPRDQSSTEDEVVWESWWKTEDALLSSNGPRSGDFVEVR